MNHLPMKPGTLLAPVPVALIGSGNADAEGKPIRNLMTAAWVGTVNSEPPMVSASVRPSRYTLGLIDATGEFTVCLTDTAMDRGTDLCGVCSGRDGDKFDLTGWHPLALDGLRYAPGVTESPLCLGCKVRQRIELGSHVMFIGEIISMTVREDLLDEKGAILLHQDPLLTYSHGVYSATGAPLGFFGWSVAAPQTLARRMDALKKGK